MNAPAIIKPRASEHAGFTAPDFMRMVELGAFENMKVELVDGEIIRMTPPHATHGERQAAMIFALMRAYEGTALLVGGETGLQLAIDTVRAADAVVYTPDRDQTGLLEPANVTLVVEIADTTLPRDLGSKARDYARAGIACCLVYDVKARCAHILTQPSADEYAERRVVQAGEQLRLPGAERTLTLP